MKSWRRGFIWWRGREGPWGSHQEEASEEKWESSVALTEEEDAGKVECRRGLEGVDWERVGAGDGDSDSEGVVKGSTPAADLLEKKGRAARRALCACPVARIVLSGKPRGVNWVFLLTWLFSQVFNSNNDVDRFGGSLELGITRTRPAKMPHSSARGSRTVLARCRPLAHLNLLGCGPSARLRGRVSGTVAWHSGSPAVWGAEEGQSLSTIRAGGEPGARQSAAEEECPQRRDLRGSITGCRARMDAKPQAAAVALPPNRCAGRHCRYRWKRFGRLMYRDVAKIRNLQLTKFLFFFLFRFLDFCLFTFALVKTPVSHLRGPGQAEPSAFQLHLRRALLVFPR